MTQWRRGYLQRPSSTLIPDPTQPTLLSPDPPCFFQSSSSVSNTPSQTAPSAPSPSPPSNLVYQPDAENPADHILSRLPPRRCHLKFCHLCRWSVYLLHPFSSLSLTESFILSGNQLQICVYLILYQHFSRYLLPLTSSSSRKQGPDQPETSGPALKSQRTKMSKSEDTEKKNKKLKDAEICVPIVYGNVAFWLGKKASEYQSHKWTVYVRGASNEDLSAVIRRAVFQLHSSFNNPTRVVEAPPFELSESGWGEFEIAITLFFHNDVCDKPLNLFHHLKLYPEEDSGPMSTKKPVVVESYDEIVFPEPSENLLGRLQNHPAITLPRLPSGYNLPPVATEEESKKKRGDTKDHPLSQWFLNFSEADELLQLAAARQQVQAHIAKLKRQISLLDGQQQQQQQQLRSTSEQ